MKFFLLLIGLPMLYLPFTQDESAAIIRQKRAENISNAFAINLSQALTLVDFLDKNIRASNLVYNDTTLTSEEKGRRLLLLEQEKDRKFREIAPDINQRQQDVLRKSLKIKTNEK